MKILVLCYEYPPLGGGGAKVVSGLNKVLLENDDIQIDVVTMGFKGIPSKEDYGNLRILRVPSIRKKLFVTDYSEISVHMVLSLFYTINLCRKNNYDFIHSHFILPDSIISYVLKKLFGIKYFITAHGSDVPGYNPNKFKFMHKLITPLWKRVIKNAEKVAFPSRSLLELANIVMPQNNAVIIPNGINMDKFSGMENKENKILIVTRMLERKGVQYFLEALIGFKHNYEINIVGDGPFLPELKKIASDNSLDVKFWGHLDNTSEEFNNLFENSRIFVFTSESENFPIVLLEAMIAGMAIITTNDTGCAEVVGSAGMLVNSRSSSEIKDILIRLVNDTELCAQLGTAARKRVEDNFSWNIVAAKYFRLFTSRSPSMNKNPLPFFD